MLFGGNLYFTLGDFTAVLYFKGDNFKYQAYHYIISGINDLTVGEMTNYNSEMSLLYINTFVIVI